MPRFKLFIEYEGTRYRGWQAQKEARTIEGEFISAIEKILHTNDFEFNGSSRTDAGVHALRQVAHLDIMPSWEPDKLRFAINDHLPADINVLTIERAPKNFHARHDAIGRSYVYQIARRRSAFGKRFTWWIKDRLDFQVMKKESELFKGMKNFQSFTADDPDDKSMKVLIESIEMKEENDLILIRITGSHFLWKMVRQIVGVLAEIGRGKMSETDIRKFFQSKSGIPAILTAPPSGLFLERVYYKGDERFTELKPVMSI
ncbi:tRNA pseudouridine(38-40) synthase TruA [bacterium]|nr:tRNA pseudouridine(38-40) synthase TruA [bacterium]